MLFVLGMSSVSSITAQDEPAPYYRLIVAKINSPENQTILSRIDVETGKVVKLLTLNAPEAAFSISPRGDRVAYSVLLDPEKAWTKPRETGISAFMLDLVSAESTLLAENTYTNPPVWSPDGGQVLIADLDETNLHEREVMITGGDTRLRFKPRYVPDVEIMWSPDGSMLAYGSQLPNGSGYAYLFALRADGTDRGHVLLPEAPGHAHGFTIFGWIPGTHDILIRWGGLYEAGPSDVLRVNADDGTFKTLIAWDTHPAHYWIDMLNDGRALYASSEGYGLEIYWLDLDNGVRTPTMIRGDLLDRWSFQKFSPDQTRAAIATYDANGKPHGIAVYDLETGAELANTFVTADYVKDLIWSTDGQKIAVVTAAPEPSTDTAIYILNADGSGTPQRVAQDVGTILVGWQSRPDPFRLSYLTPSLQVERGSKAEIAYLSYCRAVRKCAAVPLITGLT